MGADVSKHRTLWPSGTPEIIVTEPSDIDSLNELPEAPSQDSVYSTASSNMEELEPETPAADVVLTHAMEPAAHVLTVQSPDSVEHVESVQITLSSTEVPRVQQVSEYDPLESDLPQGSRDVYIQEASKDGLLNSNIEQSINDVSAPENVEEAANLSLPRNSSTSSLIIPESFNADGETILSEPPPYPSDNEHEVSLDTEGSDDSVHFTISNESVKHLGLDVSQERRESKETREGPSKAVTENVSTEPLATLHVPRPVTYADATNLAMRFPGLASRILESPLAAGPPPQTEMLIVSNSPEPPKSVAKESITHRPRRRHWKGKNKGATSHQSQHRIAETETDLIENVSEAAPDWANAPPERSPGRASLQTNRNHSGRGRRPRGGKKPRKSKESHANGNYEAPSAMEARTMAPLESYDGDHPRKTGYGTGGTMDNSILVLPQKYTATACQQMDYAPGLFRGSLNLEVTRPSLYPNATIYDAGSRFLDRISSTQVTYSALALTKDEQRQNVQAMMDDAKATIDISSMANVTWPSTSYYACGRGSETTLRSSRAGDSIARQKATT